MAVYTEVSDEELQAFLARYDLGDVTSFKGIAEGVETQEDIDAIRALGCRMFQGYAIARPLAEADLAAFLKDKALKPPAETQTAGRNGLPKIA